LYVILKHTSSFVLKFACPADPAESPSAPNSLFPFWMFYVKWCPFGTSFFRRKRSLNYDDGYALETQSLQDKPVVVQTWEENDDTAGYEHRKAPISPNS